MIPEIYFEVLDKIQSSTKPISIAWYASCNYLGFEIPVEQKKEELEELDEALFDPIFLIDPDEDDEIIIEPKKRRKTKKGQQQIRSQNPVQFIRLLTNFENIFINSNPYHNQYHLAETIWNSAILIKEELNQEEIYQNSLILLLAATFIDAEHPGKKGKSNQSPFETERLSVSFFGRWWTNNSLFVENVLNIDPVIIEQIVMDLILFTDNHQGKERVNKDYEKHLNHESYGFKLVRLKKILNEADHMLFLIPQQSIKKIKLLVSESGVHCSDENIISILHDFVESKQNYSQGSKKLEIDKIAQDFLNIIKISKTKKESLQQLQERIFHAFH